MKGKLKRMILWTIVYWGIYLGCAAFFSILQPKVNLIAWILTCVGFVFLSHGVAEFLVLRKKKVSFGKYGIDEVSGKDE